MFLNTIPIGFGRPQTLSNVLRLNSICILVPLSGFLLVNSTVRPFLMASVAREIVFFKKCSLIIFVAAGAGNLFPSTHGIKMQEILNPKLSFQ